MARLYIHADVQCQSGTCDRGEEDVAEAGFSGTDVSFGLGTEVLDKLLTDCDLWKSKGPPGSCKLL